MDKSRIDAIIARIAGRKSKTLVPVEVAPRRGEAALNLIHDRVRALLIEHMTVKIHTNPYLSGMPFECAFSHHLPLPYSSSSFCRSSAIARP